MINPGSLADILFWSTFQKLQLNPNSIKAFHRSLVGLSSEQVKVRGIITLKITSDSIADSNVIEVNYLMADALSTYNVILCQPTINSLEVIISTQYMVLKYPLPNRRVGTVRGDQESAQECY